MIGAAAAVTAAIIYDAISRDEDEEEYLQDEDSSEIIDKANDYLSEARVKAKELVDYANKRSDELLGEAGDTVDRNLACDDDVQLLLGLLLGALLLRRGRNLHSGLRGRSDDRERERHGQQSCQQADQFQDASSP